MDVPKELLFTKTHEWIRVEGEVATVGISDFAQQQLSDLTYVELPGVGDAVNALDEVGVVESVKAASDIYAPLPGEMVEVHDAVCDNPEMINTDPYGEGWLFNIKLSDPGQVADLLNADQYEELAPDE